MFPNDDICNVDAARQAAKRLFSRYSAPGNKDKPSLGKNQVNSLMKATYEAINMPYKPDEEDVFSFMSVFDSNNDGRIELKDIQELAVKYLCGEEALDGLRLSKEQKHGINNQPRAQSDAMRQKQARKEVEKIEKTEKRFEQDRYRGLKIQTGNQSSHLQRIYSPKVNYQPSLSMFYSPKNRIPSKQSAASTSLESDSVKHLAPSQESSPLAALWKQGKVIFQKHKNHALGITETSAAKALTETYELLGKKNYSPTVQDVRIWLKLCDKNKDGIVDWQDFRYFIQRSYERSQGSK